MRSHHQQSYTAQTLHVFLCYDSGDESAVRSLYKRLQGDGVMPWLDKEDVLPGQNWRTEIPKIVRKTDVVLVCLSHSSVEQAGYAQKEIKLALDVADEQPENSIFVIPVCLEECNLPDRLSNLRSVNLFEEDGYERLMQALKHRENQLGRVRAPVPNESDVQAPTPTATQPVPGTKVPPISASAGCLHLTFTQTGEDWLLQLHNRENHDLARITVYLQPPAALSVHPTNIKLSSLAAGKTTEQCLCIGTTDEAALVHFRVSYYIAGVGLPEQFQGDFLFP